MERRSTGPTGAAWSSPCHVWVGNDSTPKPGLFLYWDEIDGRLHGYVVAAWGGGTTLPAYTASWVPASELRKAVTDVRCGE